MRTIIQKPFLKLGQAVREARSAQKMTQGDLARRLQVGQQAVSRWERGESRPESKALVEALAGLFPERELSAWLEMAGYGKVPQIGKPVRPLLETLPLDLLLPQQFEGFSQLLLEFLCPGATVNRFGVHGDRQDGIDVEVRFPDGRYHTFQCKRMENFGPQQVNKAIAQHKVDCDLAVLLLSRAATVGARSVIPAAGARIAGKRWELWDAVDIANRIRGLPLTQQRRVVDTYFRAYRKDFLGIDEPGAFELWNDYFGVLLQRDQAFSHGWTLVGRDEKLKQLLSWLEQPLPVVSFLSGNGGIGKSRVAYAAASEYQSEHPTHEVFVLASGRIPSQQDLDTLADRPSLVIIEDAHEHAGLDTVLAIFARLPREQFSIRLLIVTRSYALPYLRGEASRNGLRTSEKGIIQLDALSKDEAAKIAGEILAATRPARRDLVQLAPAIATVTRQSSLATIVGSYLVATAQIHPAALNNLQDFRDQLFPRFREALTQQIGSEAERETIHETLNLLSLVQPLDPDSPLLANFAEKVIGVPVDKVRRAIQLLHDGGVLVRRGQSFRIVPDLLAEYVLEEAAFLKSTGKPSGYIERVLPFCDERLLANALLNVARLDWRLTKGDEHQVTLVDAVWASIGNAFAGRTLPQQTIVEAVSQAAFFQPERALDFYERLREQGHTSSASVRLLKHAALAGQFERAAVHLWDLAERQEKTLFAEPLQILKELAQVTPGKSLEYSDQAVTFAIGLINQGRGGIGDRSAYAILRAALATEGYTTESRGYSVVMSGFGVLAGAAAPLRRRIIDFLLLKLTSSDLITAAQSASAFSDALRPPMGLVNRPVSAEERQSWTAEFMHTFDRLRAIVVAGTLDPFVAIQLQRSIKWHAGFGAEPTKEVAQRVIAAIPQTFQHKLSLALVDAWGALTRAASEDVQDSMRAWQTEQSNFASDLVGQYPTIDEILDIVAERLSTLRPMRGLIEAHPGVFTAILIEAGQGPSIGVEICRRVLRNPQDALAEVFAESLLPITRQDPETGYAIALQALKTTNTGLHRSVAWAYDVRLQTADAINPYERDLVETLIRNTDVDVVVSVLRGVVKFAAIDRGWAVSTLLMAPFERSRRIANEIFSAFAISPHLSFDSLGRDLISQFIEKLKLGPSLEEHWIGEFLARASSVAPRELVQLFMDRIDIATTTNSTAELDPLPGFGDFGPKLHIRDSTEFPDLLRLIREWLLSRTPSESWIPDHCGSELYAAVAQTFDAIVVADLEEWSRSGDEQKLQVISSLLARAPNNFVFDHETFVTNLLESAQAVGQTSLDRVHSALWNSSQSGVRHGTPGQPFSQDQALKTNSSEALKRISRSSPAYQLYLQLNREAEAGMKWKRRTDEALFQE